MTSIGCPKEGAANIKPQAAQQGLPFLTHAYEALPVQAPNLGLKRPKSRNRTPQSVDSSIRLLFISVSLAGPVYMVMFNFPSAALESFSHGLFADLWAIFCVLPEGKCPCP